MNDQLPEDAAAQAAASRAAASAGLDSANAYWAGLDEPQRAGILMADASVKAMIYVGDQLGRLAGLLEHLDGSPGAASADGLWHKGQHPNCGTCAQVRAKR